MTLLLVAKLNFNPQVLRWLDRLQDLGVHVVCLHIGNARELAPIRSRVHSRVHYLFVDAGGGAGIRSIYRLFSVYRHVLRTEQPDAVWVLCLWTLLVPLIWALRGRKIPLILTACGSDVNTGARSWRNRILFRYVLSRAALVCTTTCEMMARLKEIAAIHPGRALTLYWGIDTAAFFPAGDAERITLRRKWGVGTGSPAIYMGRILRPIAYYREALAAISTVIKSNGLRDLKLVFVNWASDAGIVREVRELIDALGLCGQVIFIDRELDAQELREVYAIADITLNLLRQDQLGSTIFEALAVGSLLVTTDLPQYQRVAAEGARFWFVRTSHVETDLARTLEELIQNLPQAKRRAILPNQEMVRAEYRFDKNSLAFVAAIRKVIQVVQEVPQVLS